MIRRYQGWPVTAKIGLWLVVVLVVVPLLFAALIRVIPVDSTDEEEPLRNPPGAIGALMAPETAEAHVRSSDRRNLRRAHRHHRHGHPRHVRRYLKRVRHWKHIPVRHRRLARRQRTVHRRGCKYVGSADAAELPSFLGGGDLWQGEIDFSFCYRRGRVTDVRDFFKWQRVWGWGRQLSWSYDGMVPWHSINRFERWHDRPHGSHVKRRVFRFVQCTPVYLGGCGVFYQVKFLWLQVKVFGDGTWRRSSGIS